MTHYETVADLRDALAMVAVAKGSNRSRLARAQRHMVDSPAAMLSAGLPSGQFRSGLADAMYTHQTPEGKRYAVCIICGEATSRTDKSGNPLPSSHPAFPALVTLIPSVLFRHDDTDEVAPGTSPRVGYVPFNVAIGCADCAAWKAGIGRHVTFEADTVDANLILGSWAGIKSVKRASDAPDIAASRARRDAARRARFTIG